MRVGSDQERVCQEAQRQGKNEGQAARCAKLPASGNDIAAFALLVPERKREVIFHVGGNITMIQNISIVTGRRGLHEISAQVNELLATQAARFNQTNGLCTLFVQHTSASLLIQENADILARNDLEAWLDRLVPRNDPLYTHTQEGPDDMPSHIKSMLTATTVSVPYVEGALALGVWQGVFLWEHRDNASERQLIIHTCA